VTINDPDLSTVDVPSGTVKSSQTDAATTMLPAGGNGSVNGGGNKKNKKNRRVFVWLFAIVVVVVVVILVENETELRQAEDLATTTSRSSRFYKNKEWQSSSRRPNDGADETGSLGAMYGKDQSSEVQGVTTHSHNKPHDNLFDKRNRDTEMIKKQNINRMDDDLFVYFRSSRTTPDGKNINSINKQKSGSFSAGESNPLINNKKKIKNKSRDAKTNPKKKLQPFPVIRYDDDNIPQGAAGSVIHAADALLCRESVIDYVINATDLKDECDGLKKAFTKTCADDQDAGNSKGASAVSRRPDENVDTSRRRRLTSGDAAIFQTSNPIIKWQHALYRWSRYIQRQPRRFYRSITQPAVFMAEDEVLKTWDDALEEVEDGWDWRYRHNEIQFILNWVVKEERNHPDEPLSTANGTYAFGPMKPKQKQHRRKLQDDGTDGDGRGGIIRRAENKKGETPSSQIESNEKNITVVATVPPARDVAKESSNKHMANLALPTTVKHVSEKMLSETLMLQQDNKLMKAVQNQTNHTVSDAQADAAASVKAVSDANDFVASVLNDPTSVEARTCCTSILNVFHENCNVEPEEELSDSRLFVAILVIAVCGLVKSLIRHFTIRWLPEAAGCILVGGKIES
jgi:hypothetical protein